MTTATSPYTRLARGLSLALHPLLVPLYVMAVLLFARTTFAYYPLSVKFYLLWVVALYATVIPLLTVGLLRSVGRITSLSIENRRERLIPLAVGALCYVLCAVTLVKLPSAMLLRRFILAGACCELLCLAVTYYWKISLHLTTLGAVTAFLFIGSVGGVGRLAGAFVAAVLCAGALASARLYLGRHTPAQVAAGFALGFVTTAVVVLFG